MKEVKILAKEALVDYSEVEPTELLFITVGNRSSYNQVVYRLVRSKPSDNYSLISLWSANPDLDVTFHNSDFQGVLKQILEMSTSSFSRPSVKLASGTKEYERLVRSFIKDDLREVLEEEIRREIADQYVEEPWNEED